MIYSKYVFLYLFINSLIQFSVAHRWNWLHEWSHNKIIYSFWILTLFQVIFVNGIVNYQVSFNLFKVFDNPKSKSQVRSPKSEIFNLGYHQKKSTLAPTTDTIHYGYKTMDFEEDYVVTTVGDISPTIKQKIPRSIFMIFIKNKAKNNKRIFQ